MDTAPTKPAARAVGDMANLIVLILSEQPDYTIKDSAGYVSRQIRELGNVPDTPAIRSIISKAIKLLEDNGRIVREKPSRHRTVMIKLNTEGMNDHDFESLWNQSEVTRTRAHDIFRDVVEKTGEYSFDQLVEDCRKAYEAFQDAIRTAPEDDRMRSNAQAALVRGTSVLSELGLHGNRARIVRYYLKELNLAKTVDRVASRKYDWYWWANVIEFRPNVLRDRVKKDGQIWQPPKGVNPYRPWWEDTPLVRRFAGDTPAVLPDSLCGPVQVTKVKEVEVMEKTVAEPAPAPEPVQIDEEKPVASPADVEKPTPVRQLIAIIERLERKIKALQAGNEAKDREIRQLKLDKKELEEALGIALENSSQDKADAEAFLKKYHAS